MASSKVLLDHQQDGLVSVMDLTLCGICLESVNEPKALPCLHTFCFGCIKERNHEKTDQVTCPVCKVDFPLPPGGVSELKTNQFVARLTETQQFKDKVAKKELKCTFCEKGDVIAVARCMNCKEYLCISCVDAHKTYKILKGHNVVSFQDIETNKIDLHKTSTEELCPKHKGQVMWFFCETCGHLICRDCIVVDHPASTHTFINVDEASETHSQKLKELSSKCQIVTQEVDKAIKGVGEVQRDLDEALENAKKALELSRAKIKSEILKHLEDEQQKISDKIDNIGSHNTSIIKLDSDRLQSQRLQLERALKVTTHVTENGSPFDIAAMYTTLTDTMQRLTVMKGVNVEKSLSLVSFSASTKPPLLNKFKLGTVVDGYKENQLTTLLSRVKFGVTNAGNSEAPKLAFGKLENPTTSTRALFSFGTEITPTTTSTSATTSWDFSFGKAGFSTKATSTLSTTSGEFSFVNTGKSTKTTTTNSSASGGSFNFGKAGAASNTTTTSSTSGGAFKFVNIGNSTATITSSTSSGGLNFGMISQSSAPSCKPATSTATTTSQTSSGGLSFGPISQSSTPSAKPATLTTKTTSSTSTDRLSLALISQLSALSDKLTTSTMTTTSATSNDGVSLSKAEPFSTSMSSTNIGGLSLGIAATSTTKISSAPPTSSSDELSFGKAGTSTKTTTSGIDNKNANEMTRVESAFREIFENSPTPRTSSSVKSARSGTDINPEDEREIHFEPITKLPDKVDLQTGEESEETLFCSRSKLYRFDQESKAWKDRGVGDVKILKNKETERFRVIMRRDQVLKVCANHYITTDMKLTPNAGSLNSWMWLAMEAAEGEPKFEQLAIKFNLKETTFRFKEVFEECQKKLKDENGGGVEVVVQKEESTSDTQAAHTSDVSLQATNKPATPVTLTADTKTSTKSSSIVGGPVAPPTDALEGNMCLKLSAASLEVIPKSIFCSPELHVGPSSSTKGSIMGLLKDSSPFGMFRGDKDESSSETTTGTTTSTSSSSSQSTSDNEEMYEKEEDNEEEEDNDVDESKM